MSITDPAPVGDRIALWLLQANRGDEGRALLAEAWIENQTLHSFLRDVIPRAQHEAEIAALHETIARLNRRQLARQA